MMRGKLAPAPPKKAASKPKAQKGATPCAPISRLSISDGKGTERSVGVRKIDNGYVITETTYGPKGEYRSNERYSPKPPKIDIEAVVASSVRRQK